MENPRLNKLLKESDAIFYGDIGVKQVYYGDKLIFDRKGAYFYLDFKKDGENLNG